jgi:hypothetical protein
MPRTSRPRCAESKVTGTVGGARGRSRGRAEPYGGGAEAAERLRVSYPRAGSSSDGKIIAAPWFFSADLAQNRASLKALAERLRPNAAEVKALVTAHTGVLHGLAPLAAFDGR